MASLLLLAVPLLAFAFGGGSDNADGPKPEDQMIEGGAVEDSLVAAVMIRFLDLMVMTRWLAGAAMIWRRAKKTTI
ncbi:MAG: Uncharacterized protein FD162_470 [Rhodobacteraceae bacterium]|nr:MAG: Uncharacterized protein FD162_470 [Paracoccaceae bacterium]